jgi:hypothetical protein
MFTPRLALVFASLSITTLCGNASHAQDVDALSILSLGRTAPKSTGADLSSLKLRPTMAAVQYCQCIIFNNGGICSVPATQDGQPCTCSGSDTGVTKCPR